MIGKFISEAYAWSGEAFAWLGDLLADIFWGTVTSYPAISIFGVVAVITFAVAHAPLIERLFPSVIVYTKAAGAVCLVSSSALMFAFGFRVADGRDEIERLKNDLAFSEFELDQQRQVADAADELKRAADVKADEARGQLDAWRKKFGDDPDSACAFTREYLDWMRNRNTDRQRRADAESPRRGLVARVRALGATRR
jgi:hypothetical protein